MSGAEAGEGTPLTRMGWIPFWNLHPLRYELERMLARSPLRVQMHQEVPRVVNEWLRAGKVDIAPSSSMNLVAAPHLRLAASLGVAADGQVMSVYLGFHPEHRDFIEFLGKQRRLLAARLLPVAHDPTSWSASLARSAQQPSRLGTQQLPSLCLSAESDTSNALAQMFFRAWLGRSVSETMVESGRCQVANGLRPVTVMIGDRALEQRRNFYRIWDLATLWKEVSGYPMVFALWQSAGGQVAPELIQLLSESAHKAERKMKMDPRAYLADGSWAQQERAQLLTQYWQCIDFCLGEREMLGLMLFYAAVRAVGLLPAHAQALPRIASLQHCLSTKGWQAGLATADLAPASFG